MKLLLGDCVETMKTMPANSIDSIVCDPPYGLEFMGKEWDKLDVRQPGDNNYTMSASGPYSRTKVRNSSAQSYGGSVGIAMQEWHRQWASEALRVAKPGALLFAFGGTRTWHRLACAIEDAGWEIRDTVCWLHGQGFPKSHDISKAIDKAAPCPTCNGAGKVRTRYEYDENAKDWDAAWGSFHWVEETCATCKGKGKGAKREVVGPKMRPDGKTVIDARRNGFDGQHEGYDRPWKHDREAVELQARITAPATPLVALWDGWGTALKPAWESVIVAQKPIDGTYAENAEKWGVAGLNIDGGRIGTETVTINTWNDGSKPFGNGAGHPYTGRQSSGRWPANVILSHTPECKQVGTKRVKSGTAVRKNGAGGGTLCSRLPPSDDATYADADGLETVEEWDCSPDCPVRLLDEQSGERMHGAGVARGGGLGKTGHNASIFAGDHEGNGARFGDTGGASRFFYCAKSSRSEREAGLEGMERDGERVIMASSGRTQIGGEWVETHSTPIPRTNHHPTVKPLALMRYLVRLCKTPTGGLVLDPFMGSGTTGVACVLENRDFIGIEREQDYMNIAKKRIEHAIKNKDMQLGLFDDITT